MIGGSSGGGHRVSARPAVMATAGPVHPIAQTPNPIPTVDRRPRTSADSIQSFECLPAIHPEGHSPPSSSGSSSTLSEPSCLLCWGCRGGKLDTAPRISGATPRSPATVLVANAETSCTERIPMENLTYSYMASRGIFTTPGSVQPPTSNVRGAVSGSRDAMSLPAFCIVCASAEFVKRTENEMQIRKSRDGNEAIGRFEMPDGPSHLRIPEVAGHPEARRVVSETTLDSDTETTELSTSSTRVYDSDGTIEADGPDWTI
ncbi:hypothetical protein RB601_008416 [Gaeumannomyces tritici]